MEIVCCNGFKVWKLYLSIGVAIIGSVRLYEFVNNILFKKIITNISSRCEVIYSPTPVSVPLVNGNKSVLSLHDVQHIHFPDNFGYFQLRYRKVAYTASILNSDYIQASSLYMRDDFLENYDGINKENTLLISEGVNIELFATQSLLDVRKKYNIDGDFLFLPAQLWPHKNHITVLKALNLIASRYNKKITLILTGQEFCGAKQIFDYINEHSMGYVLYLGKVPVSDLVALYQAARFVIAAVLYESSSLPILEAAAAGTSIIASNTCPNIELSEILEINLFDALNVSELAELIMNVWHDDNLIGKQILYNRAAVETYSWSSVAKKYVEVFERI